MHLMVPRPADQIREYTWQMVNFLLTKNVKMIVLACNTATAVVWEEVKAKLDIPVLGVILPGASAAIKSTTQSKNRGHWDTDDGFFWTFIKEKIQSLAPDMEVEQFSLSQVCSFSGIKRVGIQCDQKGGLRNPKTTSWKG